MRPVRAIKTSTNVRRQNCAFTHKEPTFQNMRETVYAYTAYRDPQTVPICSKENISEKKSGPLNGAVVAITPFSLSWTPHLSLSRCLYSSHTMNKNGVERGRVQVTVPTVHPSVSV